jgi:hypothetical protein
MLRFSSVKIPQSMTLSMWLKATATMCRASMYVVHHQQQQRIGFGFGFGFGVDTVDTVDQWLVGVQQD